MRSFKKTFYRVCFPGFFLLTCCQRDIPIPPLEKDDMRSVTFRLSGFESEVTPLSRHDVNNLMGFKNAGIQALHNLVPGPEPQYLYYWSFNDENLEPDIAVDAEGAGITFEASAVGPKFFSGFSGDGYDAGQSMSLTAVKSLIITLAMEGVESLGNLAFDISSSDTGPKDFLLSYSIDGGLSYEVLKEGNQFENMGPQSRNSYDIDVSIYPQFIGVKTVRLKLDFLPGSRDGAGDYKESSGAVRFDNIRLSGVYNGEGEEETDLSMPSTLRYYVFSSSDGNVVAQEELALDKLAAGGLLKIKLSPGTYDVLFLAYRSNGSILLPEDLTNANEFYFGQDFNDYQAVTYALLKQHFEVGATDVTEPAVLTRCFSLVTFNFTDLWTDLAEVKKIDITRQHDNYLYTPYGNPAEVPIVDLHTLTFDELVAAEDYQLRFHQFLGIPDDLQYLSYELTAYGMDGKKLNTVILSERIRNNVQLRFSGRLLADLDRFSIGIDPDWDETIEHDF